MTGVVLRCDACRCFGFWCCFTVFWPLSGDTDEVHLVFKSFLCNILSKFVLVISKKFSCV
jgi:hypothetical protein